jgi:RHS repeat-associated protein
VGWLRAPADVPRLLHGTLLQDKQDGSGLHYRRNRYYDPATGRFTQEDPIGLAGGVNVYGFAAGDPVLYGDPYGLDPCDKTTDKIGLVACKAGQKVKPVAPALNAAAFAITMLPLAEGYGAVTVLGLAGARQANLSAGVLGGSIRHVNAVGGTLNCANCAIATAATLAGRPASALNGGLTSKTILQAQYGSTFRFVGTNIAAVEAEMQAAGSGAQAIVYGWRTGEPYAHFFNVINQKGTVRFVDGQAGGAARLVYDHYQVMLLPNP